MVKVYPISALDDSIEAYISGGASAIVLSDAIFDKEAMRHKNFNAISDLAHLVTSYGYKL
ncbi:hypothetical protein ACLOJK_027405 [Asimina triloba]